MVPRVYKFNTFIKFRGYKNDIEVHTTGCQHLLLKISYKNECSFLAPAIIKHIQMTGIGSNRFRLRFARNKIFNSFFKLQNGLAVLEAHVSLNLWQVPNRNLQALAFSKD